MILIRASASGWSSIQTSIPETCRRTNCPTGIIADGETAELAFRSTILVQPSCANVRLKLQHLTHRVKTRHHSNAPAAGKELYTVRSEDS